jgi:hypothetical protein
MGIPERRGPRFWLKSAVSQERNAANVEEAAGVCGSLLP